MLDLWFEKKVRKECKGQAYIVRYADDFVCCFQYQQEAYKFFGDLKERLRKFNLEIAEDKSKAIPFGKYAKERCNRKGQKKPPTFNFLGFTHYCSESKNGNFRVKRKTDKKKMRNKLKQTKEWLKANRTRNIHDVMTRLKRSLVGYYNYYCITDNTPTVDEFRDKVRGLLFKWMNRRSQKKSFNWKKFVLFLKKFPLPRPKVKVSIYELRKEISYIL